MTRYVLLTFLLISFSSHGNSLSKLESEIAQQQYERATITGLALLERWPEDDQILFLTALAFQRDQQPQQALRYYRQLNRQNPKLPEPLNNIALIHLQQGDHDEAVDALIASLKTHPAYATAWQNLSDLYQGLASEAYRKALSEENHTGQVLDKIKLTALNRLHTPLESTALQENQDNEKVQMAAANIAPASDTIEETSVKKTTHLDQPPSESEPEQQFANYIKIWAGAWSNKDFETYINSYEKNYKGRQRNHQSWVSYRRSRIMGRGDIDVQVNNIQIKSRNQERVIIDFEQAFKSPTYRDKVIKRITLTKQDSEWKISQERTLSVL